MATNAFTATYTFPVTGSPIRTVSFGDLPWFVAADVCPIVGFDKSGMAVRDLAPNERWVHPFKTAGGEQRMKIISWDGLTKLITRSSRAEATAFQEWLTEVVLPTARKHVEAKDWDRAPLSEEDENDFGQKCILYRVLEENERLKAENRTLVQAIACMGKVIETLMR